MFEAAARRTIGVSSRHRSRNIEHSSCAMAVSPLTGGYVAANKLHAETRVVNHSPPLSLCSTTATASSWCRPVPIPDTITTSAGKRPSCVRVGAALHRPAWAAPICCHPQNTAARRVHQYVSAMLYQHIFRGQVPKLQGLKLTLHRCHARWDHCPWFRVRWQEDLRKPRERTRTHGTRCSRA